MKAIVRAWDKGITSEDIAMLFSTSVKAVICIVHTNKCKGVSYELR
jgi:hypothetical protein